MITITNITYDLSNRSGGTFFDNGKTSLPVVSDPVKRRHQLINWGAGQGDELPEGGIIHLTDLERGRYAHLNPIACGIPCGSLAAKEDGTVMRWYDSPYTYDREGIAGVLLSVGKRMRVYIIVETKDMFDDAPFRDWIVREFIYAND